MFDNFRGDCKMVYLILYSIAIGPFLLLALKWF